MSSTDQQLLTAEEFWLLAGCGKRRELVRGEVIESIPPGGQHGAIAGSIYALLRAWIKVIGGGYAAVEAGYVLAQEPDTVRGADVSYVRADRIPATGVPEAFWHSAPDLAVEVISPSETAGEIRYKVRDYLHAGTPLVWTVYPRTREVLAFTPDGKSQTFGENDTLEFPAVLPGFRCVVREIFE